MNDANELKLERVKEFLTERGIFFTEHANGQLQVDGVNIWATTENFYDPRNGYRGRGVNALVEYISKKNANQ